MGKGKLGIVVQDLDEEEAQAVLNASEVVAQVAMQILQLRGISVERGLKLLSRIYPTAAGANIFSFTEGEGPERQALFAELRKYIDMLEQEMASLDQTWELAQAQEEAAKAVKN